MILDVNAHVHDAISVVGQLILDRCIDHIRIITSATRRIENLRGYENREATIVVSL